MIRRINKSVLGFQAAVIVGLMGMMPNANATGGYYAYSTTDRNFSDIAANIIESVKMMPALLSGISYLFGILLGVLGILKIKDHVENPQQTALKDGAIRMAAGGALFALPIVYEAMRETIGIGGDVGSAELNAVRFNVR